MRLRFCYCNSSRVKDLKINVSVSESATFAKDAVKVSGTILKKDGTALNNSSMAGV